MPQPIDMQTELARTLMADRIQQVSERSAIAAAMRARLQGEDEESVAETQVQDTAEPQSEHVDPELKRRNAYLRRKRKQQQDESNRNPGRPGPGGSADHSFDVSV